MKPSLYLETTIPSFLVGTLSPILATAGHQVMTRKWWDERKDDYRLYISSVVLEEIAHGMMNFALRRQELIIDLPELQVTNETKNLAEKLHRLLHLPARAQPDATHLSLACHYEIDYLLTWNMKHLANGRVRNALQRLHDSGEIFLPTICTPEELLEENFQ